MPKVRKDAGYPPLVTPSSQIVGTQAVFNVLMGRYKALTGEFADLMLGYYGETHRPARPGDHRGGRQARQEGADHRPARRPAEAGMGRAARRRRWRSRAATAPTRTCSPTPCSPRWPRSSSRTRAEGPKNVGKDRRRAAAAGRRARRGKPSPPTARGRSRARSPTSPGRREVAQGDRTSPPEPRERTRHRR